MPVPHQPPNNIPLASSLPKVSFRKIPADEARQLLAPAGVQDQQHINFGFNDGSDFVKPEHYLRYVEPIESELNRQVEYDMDEQDQEWLDALNLERRRDQQDAISYEAFEIIIDRLEKEWFDLMKRVPPKVTPLTIGADGEPITDGSEDIECAICDDGECENSNAIVFCDGCNLAVHQDCYGIPYIPEGQWLCRKCTVSPDRAVSCVLCPHEGGAFKQTAQGKWAHLLCAMWIPETGVSNPVYMEPIDSVERIPKARWKLQCYLCKHRMGACIQCDNKNCFTAFHVTCARRHDLLLKSPRQRATHSAGSESDEEEAGDLLRAWCHKHVPKAVRAQRARRREDEEDEFQDASSQPRSLSPVIPKRSTSTATGTAAPGRKKSARAYKKSYRAGPSLVPAFVLNRVLEHISRIHVRKKPQLTMQIAKYWSLKREARRGAPLLKRLHLEPWTASTSNKEQSDAERIKKLQFLLRLREDLEKVRMLAELVRKREKEKLRQVQVIRSTIVDGVLFPYHKQLRRVLERVSALDRTSLFLNPVSVQKVPDYLDVIKEPMDWTTIATKIDDFRYESASEFRRDMHLVLDNAMKYNHIDTHYHRTAARIKKVAEPVFEEVMSLDFIHGVEDDMQMEAEDSIIELLADYAGTVHEEETHEEYRNAVEELTIQMNPDEIREEPVNDGKGAKMTVQARKAAEKAARSERSRLAAQKRKETLEARKTQGGAADGDDDNDGDAKGAPRNSRRQSAIKASMASQEARKRKMQEAEEVSSLSSTDSIQADRRAEVDPNKLEVEQVDNWDSFKRFNVGWVLPEGSKRRRLTSSSTGNVNGMRLPSEQLASSSSSSSISRTRKSTGQPSSRPSELAEADKQEKKTRSHPSPKRENASRVAAPALSFRSSRSVRDAQEAATSPSRALVRGDKGRFTRTNEHDDVKEGKESQADESMTRSEEQRRKRREAQKRKKENEAFIPWTVCWAKMEGHPFYPAEVFDEDPTLVPEKVLRDKAKAASANSQESLFLVRFFDGSRSFGWIPFSKLKLLAEDEELDERMLKSCKNPKMRSRIRQSYNKAKAEVQEER